MGRKNEKFTINMSIKVNGEIVPCMTIEKDGTVTQHVSDKDREKHKKAMLKNMGESMSRYYSQNGYSAK